MHTKIVYKNNFRQETEIKNYSLCEGLIRLLPWMIFLSSVIKITLCKLCGGQAARDNDAVSIVLVT